MGAIQTILDESKTGRAVPSIRKRKPRPVQIQESSPTPAKDVAVSPVPIDIDAPDPTHQGTAPGSDVFVDFFKRKV
jgi:hypothetical protein